MTLPINYLPKKIDGRSPALAQQCAKIETNIQPNIQQYWANIQSLSLPFATLMDGYANRLYLETTI